MHRVGDNEQHDHACAYEVVAGHRRFDTARKAGLDTIVVRSRISMRGEAVERFMDDHVPIQGGDERYMYGHEDISFCSSR